MYVIIVWRAFVVCVSMPLVCFVCDVMFVSCLFFWCVCVVCGVLCCWLLLHWFVARVCFVVVVFSCWSCCYGLNASPVCDCSLYVPSLRCSFRFLCGGVRLSMDLCHGVYCGLFVYRFRWFVLCVMLFYVLFLLLCSVCMCCLWCVVLLFVVSLVCRACMCCCCVFSFCLFFCYGLNTFPVCDCMLYVPSWRCSLLFV